MTKINKVEPRIMSGFMELLPAEQIVFNRFLDTIKETFEEFGLLPMDTPVIERSEVLLAKIGEDTKKEIYRFKRGDDDLSLRFDLTVPLARFVAMNQAKLTFPFRRYQIGKVFRGERPQKGRYREFYQCDPDIIGNGSLGLSSDAEIAAIVYRIFSKFDIGEFVILTSNRKILNGLVESLGWTEKTDEVLRIVDKLEKIGQDSVKQELLNLDISLNGVLQIIEFVKIRGTNEEIVKSLRKMKVVNITFSEGIDELEFVVKTAMEFGVPEKNIQIDLSIARGLSYYTGTVYETKMLNDLIVGNVCGGGRYDNLVESYSEQSFPGVGISLGLTRLFSQLLSAGLINTERTAVADVLVAPMDEKMAFPLEVANKFRTAGIPTEVYTENDKFRKKMNYANKIGVPYVAIIGSDEFVARKVSLKNMKTGEQETMVVEEAIKILKNL
jgi:histidyl-tRNA synthetase